MNKTVLCLVCIPVLLLSSTSLVPAVENKALFNTESIKYESGTGAERCQDRCSSKSGPDVRSFLAAGWKIVSSSSKEVIGEHYYRIPCNTCKPHGCICIGTEYILQKEVPATKLETEANVVHAPENGNRTVLLPLKGEASKNELDLLKQENAVLKQENAALKQENETLRNQLRSKRK